MPNHLWSSAEDTRLAELATNGLGVTEISCELSRSTSAVRNRARRLRVNIFKDHAPVARCAPPSAPFHIGERVRLSELGRSRHPRMPDVLGTVASGSSSPNSVSVLFDGRRSPVLPHRTYLIANQDGARRIDRLVEPELEAKKA